MRCIPSDLVGKLAGWLALGVCISVAILSWFGYHAIVEWRRSSLQLAERRSNETADLLVEALTRDMRGVQESVLNSPQWNQFTPERPHQISNLIANAFARYPYPESFFAWSAPARNEAVFFNRADRRPRWMEAGNAPNLFPVVIAREPGIADVLLERILADAAHGRNVSAFETTLAGESYQVVARLTYRDAFREQLAQVAGFTVHLSWVKEHYFSELLKQVARIDADATNGLTVRVFDGKGRVLNGATAGDAGLLASRRRFALAFFDLDLVPYPLPLVRDQAWTVDVSAASDESLLQAITGANRTMLIGAASAFVLAVGLALTVRAERASARLAEMRSEFVSTVTHELKTPIATIRAAAETLSKGQLNNATLQRYGRFVTLEAKRLGRLVENLLAYARVTDIADIYVFESIEVGGLFKNIQQEYEAQLDEAGFDLQLNIAKGVPPISGDRLALQLLFDNLIDNAVKYSEKQRSLRLNAEASGGTVAISVADSGIGIPEDELEKVARKFVRGRHAIPGGSGLGLAIANRIASDHGGKVAIQSRVGVGTTVTVTLPADSPTA